jgi:hypothetical protein
MFSGWFSYDVVWIIVSKDDELVNDMAFGSRSEAERFMKGHDGDTDKVVSKDPKWAMANGYDLYD